LRETRSTEQRDFVLYIRPVWESSFGSSVNQEFLIGTNLKVRELSVWRVHYNINRNWVPIQLVHQPGTQFSHKTKSLVADTLREGRPNRVQTSREENQKREGKKTTERLERIKTNLY